MTVRRVTTMPSPCTRRLFTRAASASTLGEDGAAVTVAAERLGREEARCRCRGAGGSNRPAEDTIHRMVRQHGACKKRQTQPGSGSSTKTVARPGRGKRRA